MPACLQPRPIEQRGDPAEQFIRNYYSTVRTATPVEMFQQQMLGALAKNHPGSSYGDMVWTRTVVAESDGLLPGTLPWELLSYAGTFAAIPPESRYRVRFHLWTRAELDYTTSLPELAGKQVTLSYVGETPADSQKIADAGGMWYLPDPYLVHLQPVLKVDGCQVARGTGAIRAGLYQNSDLEFLPPAGAPQVATLVQNNILAGDYQGIGLNPRGVKPALLGEVGTGCGEEYLGQVMHQTVLTYLHRVESADDSLAALLHVQRTEDVSEAIVENSVTVRLLFGLPVEWEWVGMLVDADRSVSRPYSVYGEEVRREYMRLGGANGSVLEHRLFETVFGEEAISTIKLLGLANDLGIGLCKITGNISGECPGIAQPADVLASVHEYLAAGYDVIIPRAPLSYFKYSGTGWIAIDPTTGSAGYIIYGSLSDTWQMAGGATVKTWQVSYKGLQCLNPAGEITVDPPGDYYCACNTAHWTFTAHGLQYVGKDANGTPCQVLLTRDRQFPVDNYTIQQLAANPSFGPGEYVFRVGGPAVCGTCVPQEKRVTIVKAEVGNLDRVPVYGTNPLGTNERSAAVTLTPSPVPGGFSVTVKLNSAGGSGSATFDDGSTTKTISETTTLKVRGTANSSVQDDLKLSAECAGAECGKDLFTVSTWPYELRNAISSLSLHFGLAVDVSWKSESGDLADLANTELREYVTPSRQGANPPFIKQLPDSTIQPNPPIPGTSGVGYDTHTYQPAWVDFSTGTTGYMQAAQQYQFHDKVLNTIWDAGVLATFTITRTVSSDPGGTYKFTTTKTGTGGFSATCTETP